MRQLILMLSLFTLNCSIMLLLFRLFRDILMRIEKIQAIEKIFDVRIFIASLIFIVRLFVNIIL